MKLCKPIHKNNQGWQRHSKSPCLRLTKFNARDHKRRLLIQMALKGSGAFVDYILVNYIYILAFFQCTQDGVNGSPPPCYPHNSFIRKVKQRMRMTSPKSLNEFHGSLRSRTWFPQVPDVSHKVICEDAFYVYLYTASCPWMGLNVAYNKAVQIHGIED